MIFQILFGGFCVSGLIYIGALGYINLCLTKEGRKFHYIDIFFENYKAIKELGNEKSEYKWLRGLYIVSLALPLLIFILIIIYMMI